MAVCLLNVLMPILVAALFSDVANFEAIPLDEVELGRRLHRIYRELNYA